eukprot:223298_1
MAKNYSFFIEWDHLQDYLRFGIGHNLDYRNNEIVIETNYHVHGGPTAEINTVLFLTNIDVYNTTTSNVPDTEVIYNFYYNGFEYVVNSEVFGLKAVNTTNPKQCYGYGSEYIEYSRITVFDESIWNDDCSTYLWRTGNKDAFSLHPTYMHYFEDKFYCFHGKFKQKKWQRYFKIDENVQFDYIHISFNIFTFCSFSIRNGDLIEVYINDTLYWSGSNEMYSGELCKHYFTKNWTVLDDKLTNCQNSADMIHNACAIPVEFIFNASDRDTMSIFTLKFVYYTNDYKSDALWGWSDLKIEMKTCKQSIYIYGVTTIKSCKYNPFINDHCVANKEEIRSIDTDSYVLFDFIVPPKTEETDLNIILFNGYDNITNYNYFEISISNG